ncbi:MAG TPA: hypothetical protein PLN21_10665 [Gemmatales bacterium]|nr:hypothetical protein [Gemmatales bacterium]
MIIQATTTAPDLGLRPIPGPHPVELPAADWWMWLIPIVLISFVWYYWWSLRKATKGDPTGQDRLYLALAFAEETGIDRRLRYQKLHHAMRDYLACLDPAWITLTADDSLPHWQKLLPDQIDLALKWHTQWQAAEAIVFGPDTVTENQVADYARLINELDLELTGENEKELKPTDLGQDRNKS